MHLRPANGEASTLALWLARPYLEAMKVDSVLPSPRRVQGAGDRITWGFEASAREPRELLTGTIHLLPEGSGMRWGRGRLGGGVPEGGSASGSTPSWEFVTHGVRRAGRDRVRSPARTVPGGGQRTPADTTTFDLVLLLIISEAIQNGLVGNDYSLTNAALIVFTLVLLDIGLSLIKQRSPRLEALIDGVPLVLFRKGKPRHEDMARERVDMDDILAAARERHGVARVEDIDEAVLERSGEISVIPRRHDPTPTGSETPRSRG